MKSIHPVVHKRVCKGFNCFQYKRREIGFGTNRFLTDHAYFFMSQPFFVTRLVGVHDTLTILYHDCIG